jgi:Ran GTPase-activating protein (RanGAP) involved in mRNA processing and transport
MIGRALTVNKRLTRVDLFDNHLENETAKQLAHALSRNSSLLQINLGLNGC